MSLALNELSTLPEVTPLKHIDATEEQRLQRRFRLLFDTYRIGLSAIAQGDVGYLLSTASRPVPGGRWAKFLLTGWLRNSYNFASFGVGEDETQADPREGVAPFDLTLRLEDTSDARRWTCVLRGEIPFGLRPLLPETLSLEDRLAEDEAFALLEHCLRYYATLGERARA